MNVLQLPLPTTALRELEHMRDSHQQPAFPLLEDPTQKVTIEREALVEFMAELCEEFGLQTQTAGLAVTYFDRHSANRAAKGLRTPRDAELTAKSCVLLASKFLESKVPAISDLCTVSERVHTREDLKLAEMDVLGMINWELHVATPHAFLEQLRAILHVTDEPGSPFVMRAEFMVDMSYYEYKILAFSPVVVAASAMMCSWHQLGDTEAEANNTARLAALCHTELAELFLCKATLLDHFNCVFTRQTSLDQKESEPRAESPDAVDVVDLDKAAAATAPLKPAGQSGYTFSPVGPDE